nr:MAG TPA: hypothetical protein [Caudoviricetes sp.]
MKLKGYIFYNNGEKVAIPEDRPSSYYNALLGMLPSMKESPVNNVQGWIPCTKRGG